MTSKAAFSPEEWKEVCRMGGLDPKKIAAGKR